MRTIYHEPSAGNAYINSPVPSAENAIIPVVEALFQDIAAKSSPIRKPMNPVIPKVP